MTLLQWKDKMRNLLLILVMGVFSLYAQAGLVQIATLHLSSSTSNVGFAGSADMTNLTDVTVVLNGFIIDGTNFPAGPETVGPNATANVFGWNSPSGTQLGLFGDLSSMTFSTGGTLYDAIDSKWTVTFPASANETLGVFVDATAVANTPEPSSMALGFMGLLACFATVAVRKLSMLASHVG